MTRLQRERQMETNPSIDHPNHPAESLLEAARLIDKDHWLTSYIHDLVQAFKLGSRIDFTTAEMLLAQEKQNFERELATARKIYRLYPQLVDEHSRSSHVDTPPERSGD